MSMHDDSKPSRKRTAANCTLRLQSGTSGSEPSFRSEQRVRRVASQYSIPSRCCISSRVTPLVSGYVKSTTKNMSAVIAAKKTKGRPRDFAATTGKRQRDDGVRDPVGGAAQALALGAHAVGEHLADVNPDHRAQRDGEESDIGHQQPTSRSWCSLLKKTPATPARQMVMPTLPTSSSVLRPTLSIRDMANKVAIRFIAPIATDCNRPELLLKPAFSKM